MSAAPLILWLDEPADVRAQMARDAAMLAAAERGGPAVMRVYAFAPPGITLGRAQDPERELDLARCRADGVAWAVRPTGGRALWHEADWTFACAGPLDHPAMAGPPHEAYARTARWLAAALRRLGVPVELTPGTPGGPGRPRAPEGAAAPCFASSARHELTLAGRKLAGIAQRETSGARLQQGSLLVRRTHGRLLDYQRGDPAVRAAAKDALEAGSAVVDEVRPGLAIGDLADALAAEHAHAQRWTGAGIPDALANAGFDAAGSGPARREGTHP